jgi:oxygen-dependent protoporphyrinogen oxidase
MTVLVDALVADLARLEVDVRTATPVERVSRDGSGWLVVGAAHEGAPEDSDDASADPADTEPVENEFTADAVIVATEEYAARALLADVVPALSVADAAEAPQIELVTLLLDAPALDAAPRGTGVLTVPGSHTAKALTHSTAKWDWVRDAARGRHVVRVSFGAQGEPAATAALDDDAAAALALSEASALLGVPLSAASLVAAERSRYIQSQPASIIGSGERRSAARSAIQKTPGLAVVGAWLAGTGLAQVVPDAVAEADRLRRALLWD